MEKTVGFIGYECEDIVLYLAGIFSALGKKIAIVDRTEQEMLLEIMELPKEEETTRMGEYHGIWLTNQGVHQENYDLVFVLFGYRFSHPKVYECGVIVMVTDGVPAHAALLKNVKQWECRRYFLVRNLVSMKHTEKYLAMLAEKEEGYGEIPYEEQDIRLRCSLGPYAECNVKRASAGMKRALLSLICFLTEDYSERVIREAIRKI